MTKRQRKKQSRKVWNQWVYWFKPDILKMNLFEGGHTLSLSAEYPDGSSRSIGICAISGKWGLPLPYLQKVLDKAQKK